MAILTVTLNPALDLETRTPHLKASEKLRCTDPTRDPGGGGLNVARAIRQLGGEAVALAAAGGLAGVALQQMMAERDTPTELLPAPGDLRQNLSVIETDTGRQYRFIFPGPSWSETDFTQARIALERRVSAGDWVVFSGSLPPGVQPEWLVDLMTGLARAGGRVVLDTSGAALRAAVAHPALGLAVLRIDGPEAETLSGQTFPTARDSADFAADLVSRGVASIVICGRGAEGSVLVTAQERWHAPVADVPVVSRTGAGDSFVAGAVLALSREMTLAGVLQHGCASASAACTTPATELCDSATVERLLGLTVSTKI